MKILALLRLGPIKAVAAPAPETKLGDSADHKGCVRKPGTPATSAKASVEPVKVWYIVVAPISAALTVARRPPSAIPSPPHTVTCPPPAMILGTAVSKAIPIPHPRPRPQHNRRRYQQVDRQTKTFSPKPVGKQQLPRSRPSHKAPLRLRLQEQIYRSDHENSWGCSVCKQTN
jgi:hypothetical protein